MKVVTPKQMNEIDKISINIIGIPGIVLMENAAFKVVEEVQNLLGAIENKKILIFAGKGNNGGDAFAAARHLHNRKALVQVYTTARKQDISGDALVNLTVLDKMGIEVLELHSDTQLHNILKNIGPHDLIIDGILGTGLKGRASGIIEATINVINDSHRTVLSIDIPSGVNSETGEVSGPCIKADKTITFGLPKIGLITNPGCEYADELVVADIGIPQMVIDQIDIKTYLIDKADITGILPVRRPQSNKGDYGKVFIVTGSTGMTGAGSLAGSAALRTGSGLVYLGVPASLVHIYDSLLVESITIPLEDAGKGSLTPECTQGIHEHLKGMDVLAVGPGLSASEAVYQVVMDVIVNCEIPMVIDADALNCISRNMDILKSIKSPAVITPHPGEMSRLMNTPIKNIQANRIGAARDFARQWNVVTVLKGSRTVVAAPDGTVYINPTGNPGMATGGTGDVLSGIIASLIGQGLSPLDAATAGVYLHGLAGDRVALKKGQHGIIASDLVDELPYCIKDLILSK